MHNVSLLSHGFLDRKKQLEDMNDDYVTNINALRSIISGGELNSRINKKCCGQYPILSGPEQATVARNFKNTVGVHFLCRRRLLQNGEKLLIVYNRLLSYDQK